MIIIINIIIFIKPQRSAFNEIFNKIEMNTDSKVNYFPDLLVKLKY